MNCWLEAKIIKLGLFKLSGMHIGMRGGFDDFTEFSISVRLLVNYTTSGEITWQRLHTCDSDKLLMKYRKMQEHLRKVQNR